MDSVNDVIFRHPVDVFYNFGPVWAFQKGKNELDNFLRKSSIIPK